MNSDVNIRQVYDNMGVIHFIGIGGIGMSGIAEVLFNMGCKIQGSDSTDSALVAQLRKLGLKIFIGHHAAHIAQCDVVVVSSAIAADNPELLAARKRAIPVLKRAEMLAELMRFYFGIAVSGSHGKTTTTSLIAAILSKAGLDPTFVIGGKVNSHGGNARLGGSHYLVAEADESDASFLHLQPMMSVITNIDNDHLGAYQNSVAQLQKAFVDFVHNLPFYGVVVLCGEDPVVRRLIPSLRRRSLSYGFSKDCDIVATDIAYDAMASHFTLHLPGAAAPYRVMLNLPGRHNILNALAAITVGFRLGIAAELIAAALAEFEGIDRRLQSHGVLALRHGNAQLIDDYGHHPSEVKAVLRTLKDIAPRCRRVLIFQPHRYTRTHALFNDFCEVLSTAEELILLDVYAAGEQPIDGADSDTLSRAIRAHGRLIPIYLKRSAEVPEVLDTLAGGGDIVITMGAGSIAKLPQRLLEIFNSPDPAAARALS